MAHGIPTGTTITFGTTGFTGRIIETIAWAGIQRSAVESTHFGSTQPSARQIGGREFLPGKLADPGTLTINVQYNPTVEIPLRQAAETITLTVPSDMASNTINGSGFVQSASIGLPLEGLATATLEIKWTGLVTTPVS